VTFPSRQALASGLFAALFCLWQSAPAAAQTPRPVAVPPAAEFPAAIPAGLTLERPDANRTRDELNNLLERFPPALRTVLALDPALLSNQAYLAPYPALSAFLAAHPEIARNPAFFLGEPEQSHRNPHERAEERAIDMWQGLLGGLAVFAGFGMAIGLLTWLIRTLIDYRRWSRLAKVQTDVHTKLLDRFGSNEELLAYIQSPAGAKFLESSPIRLDPGPRSLGAPLARILWSLQGGAVLLALGIGLKVVGSYAQHGAGEPLQAVGIIALFLGIGFIISAIMSYGVSRHLGLVDSLKPAAQSEPPVV
jgi:hypothetical protein